MQQNLLISVIVPVYNSEQFLSDCLESCLLQTYKNIEVIIVNDGSTDNSGDIIAKYIKQDNRFRVINKKNEGLVEARKTGANAACGIFLFFVDSDDIITTDAIEVLVNQQFVSKADIVIANFWVETERGYIINKIRNEFQYGIDKESMFCNLLNKTFGPTIWGKLIRTEIFKQTDTPSDITIGEDVITNFQMINIGKLRYSIADHYIYHYIQRKESMVNDRNMKTANARLKYINWVIDFLSKNHIDNSCYENSISYFLVGEYFSFLKDGGRPSMSKVLSNEIFSKHLKRIEINRLGRLRYYFIYLYGKSELLGALYRSLYLFIRNLFYTNLR